MTQTRTRRAPLLAGKWWRWSRYVLRDRCICAAPDAVLRIYDPWGLWFKTRPIGRQSESHHSEATPYRALLDLLRGLRYADERDGQPVGFTPAQSHIAGLPLTAESEQTILDWCARYGLLGVLLHRVPQVTLAIRDGVQLQYLRIGAGWMVLQREQTNPVTPILQPQAVVQPLRGAGISVEGLGRTWGNFFPEVPRDEHSTFPYPQPLTDAFWKIYAEPLDEFVSGAKALKEVLDAISMQRSPERRSLHAGMTGGLETTINGLVSPGALTVQLERRNKVAMKWVSNSLLASLTAMLLEDLAQGRALQCPCGRLFVSQAYQGKYCSKPCRWRFDQRKSRSDRAKRAKLARTDDPSLPS